MGRGHSGINRTKTVTGFQVVPKIRNDLIILHVRGVSPLVLWLRSSRSSVPKVTNSTGNGAAEGRGGAACCTLRTYVCEKKKYYKHVPCGKVHTYLSLVELATV